MLKKLESWIEPNKGYIIPPLVYIQIPIQCPKCGTYNEFAIYAPGLEKHETWFTSKCMHVDFLITEGEYCGFEFKFQIKDKTLRWIKN